MEEDPVILGNETSLNMVTNENEMDKFDRFPNPDTCDELVISDGEHTPDVSDCELIDDSEDEENYDDAGWIEREMRVSPERCTTFQNDMPSKNDVVRMATDGKPKLLSKGAQVGLCKCSVSEDEGIIRKDVADTSCIEGCEERRRILRDNLKKLLLTARKQINSLKRRVSDLENECQSSGIVKCPNCKLHFKERRCLLEPKVVRPFLRKKTVEIEFKSADDLREWLILSGLGSKLDGMPSIVEMEGRSMNLRDVGSFLPDFAIQLTREMFRREAEKEKESQTNSRTSHTIKHKPEIECKSRSTQRVTGVKQDRLKTMPSESSKISKMPGSSFKEMESRGRPLQLPSAPLRRSPRKQNKAISRQNVLFESSSTRKNTSNNGEMENREVATELKHEVKGKFFQKDETIQRTIAPAEPLKTVQDKKTEKWMPMSRKRKLETGEVKTPLNDYKKPYRSEKEKQSSEMKSSEKRARRDYPQNPNYRITEFSHRRGGQDYRDDRSSEMRDDRTRTSRNHVPKKR